MSDLRQCLEDYLSIRRQLGFKLRKDERMLRAFIAFLQEAGAARITTELALTWARLPGSAHPSHWRARLGVVRLFARYLATIDPESEIPSADLLPAHRPRVPPYLYSPADIGALMQAARGLTPPLRATACETVIGLLWSTGMRIGEALALDRQDVELSDGALHVRGRQNKQRELPLHESAAAALRRYARLRDRRWPDPETPAFFLSTLGSRLSYEAFNHTFRGLVRQAGIQGRGARGRVRAHDLRHSFAVRMLVQLYEAGADVQRLMPVLSAYPTSGSGQHVLVPASSARADGTDQPAVRRRVR
jgi:integrase/recombinase XerD